MMNKENEINNRIPLSYTTLSNQFLNKNKQSHTKQTEGVQDFIKQLGSKAWKNLIKFSAVEQYKLHHNFGRNHDVMEIFKFGLHHGVNYWSFINFSRLKSDHYLNSDFEEILLFLNKHVGNSHIGSSVQEQREVYNELVDHLICYKKLTVIYERDKSLVDTRGVMLSHKWSVNRFKREHSKLSKILADIEYQKVLKKDKANQWKKKKFLNTAKYKSLKGFTVNVNSVELHVKLINTVPDLYREGEEQHHCVYDYLTRAKNGKYLAFSVIDPSGRNQRGALGANVIPTSPPNVKYGVFDVKMKYEIAFDQLKGKYNSIEFSYSPTQLFKAIKEHLTTAGFDVYLNDINQKPLKTLTLNEYRIGVANKSSMSRIGFGRGSLLSIMGGDFDGDTIGRIAPIAPIFYGVDSMSMFRQIAHLHPVRQSVLDTELGSLIDDISFIPNHTHQGIGEVNHPASIMGLGESLSNVSYMREGLQRASLRRSITQPFRSTVVNSAIAASVHSHEHTHNETYNRLWGIGSRS